MDKLRKVVAVILLPLVVVALVLLGAGTLLGTGWALVAFNKKRRKQIAVEAAVSAVVRSAKEME